jgi:hypothetical protein
MHVRGHENPLKRLLVHASAFNLGLWMRSLFGVGTPRALQGRAVVIGALLITLWTLIYEAIAPIFGIATRRRHHSCARRLLSSPVRAPLVPRGC